MYFINNTVDLTGTEPAHSARAARARDFVNFLHACSSRGAPRAGLPVYPPLGDVAPSRSRRDHRKSKFDLRHAIKLIELYCMTKPEF
jgi:hypothetical protein